MKIGISYLSISGIVVHGRCYTSHGFYFSVTFYDCLLVDLCFLFLLLCLSRVVWAAKNPYKPVYLPSNWSLNFINILLHHITVYYITKFHYSRLLYLITSWLFINYCFYCSLSIFIFILLLVLPSPSKFYLILCCIRSFILHLCYCIYYHST